MSTSLRRTPPAPERTPPLAVVAEPAPSSAPLSDLGPAFRDLPHLALLASGADATSDGRWSYLVADPAAWLRWDAAGLRASGIEPHGRDAFAALAHALGPPWTGAAPAPFVGGAVGYLAYDVAYALERLPGRCPGPPPAGYLWAGLYDWVVARNSATGAAWIVASDWAGRDPARLVAAARDRLNPDGPPAPPTGAGRPTSNVDRTGYMQWVRTIQAYIAAGDCYQVNVARRITLPFTGDALALYRALVRAHPAPHAAYLACGPLTIASVSPELFVRVDGHRARTRPMKGTRPRGATPAEDAQLAAALARSPKDRAENVMIVDVLRNDFGRVCVPGSVHVPALWDVEAHPSVWQLVSEVRGELAAPATAADLLRACSPGGSVTGAPKIRAMQIIDELEPVRRGVYCGSLFALSLTGALTSSIAIRTLQIEGGAAHLHVGGGVVADSDPAAEYEETVHKARGILAALGWRE